MPIRIEPSPSVSCDAKHAATQRHLKLAAWTITGPDKPNGALVLERVAGPEGPDNAPCAEAQPSTASAARLFTSGFAIVPWYTPRDARLGTGQRTGANSRAQRNARDGGEPLSRRRAEPEGEPARGLSCRR